jgi:hypothetical protein
MNSTALAAVIEAAGFTSKHFVNLSTATMMCVNPPLDFLKGPTKTSPHVEKGQVMVWSAVDETTRVSGKRKTDNIHTDRLGSRRQT